ncbi:MAG: hypothetical protein ACR9NN_10260 [Nostochopsis sp.]
MYKPHEFAKKLGVTDLKNKFPETIDNPRHMQIESLRQREPMRDYHILLANQSRFQELLIAGSSLWLTNKYMNQPPNSMMLSALIWGLKN